MVMNNMFLIIDDHFKQVFIKSDVSSKNVQLRHMHNYRQTQKHLTTSCHVITQIKHLIALNILMFDKKIRLC